MGRIACYYEADEKLINSFKGKESDEILDILDQLDDDGEISICDIDEAWDSIHFLLTKSTFAEYDNKKLLDVFIFGDLKLCEDEYITVISASKVKEIFEQIKNIDINEKLKEFNPKDFDEAKIYPNIWARGEREELEEFISFSFEELQSFYSKVSKGNKGIIVSIS